MLGLAGRQELVVLGLTGRQELFVLRRGVTNDLVVVCLTLVDEALASVLTLGHVLLVQLLRQREHASRRTHACGGSTGDLGSAEPFVLGSGGGGGGKRGHGALVRGLLGCLHPHSRLRLCLLRIRLGLGYASGGVLFGLLCRHRGGCDLVLGLVLGRGLGTDAAAGRSGADRSTGGTGETLALLAGRELSAQIVVVTAQTPQLADDLVQEVVDLLLVVATAELCRSEILVEDILGRERHVVTSVEPVRGPHHRIADREWVSRAGTGLRSVTGQSDCRRRSVKETASINTRKARSRRIDPNDSGGISRRRNFSGGSVTV